MFKSLENVGIEELCLTFNDAFSTYEIPVNMTTRILTDMLKGRDYDAKLSTGYFDNDILRGFLLIGKRQKDSAFHTYDIATGVSTESQRKGVGSEIIDHTFNKLIQNNIKTFTLEVLQNNRNAITLYEKKQLSVVRNLLCFKNKVQSKENKKSELFSEYEIDKNLPEFISFHPTWQNEIAAYNNLKEQYQVYAMKSENDRLLAFCIMNQNTGSILQWGYDWLEISDTQKVLFCKQILSCCLSDEIKYINVESGSNMAHFLEDNGFENFVSQYEMRIEF